MSNSLDLADVEPSSSPSVLFLSVEGRQSDPALRVCSQTLLLGILVTGSKHAAEAEVWGDKDLQI